MGLSQDHWVAAACPPAKVGSPGNVGATLDTASALTTCRASAKHKYYLRSSQSVRSPLTRRPTKLPTGPEVQIPLEITFRASLGFWTARSPLTRRPTKSPTGPEVQIPLEITFRASLGFWIARSPLTRRPTKNQPVRKQPTFFNRPKARTFCSLAPHCQFIGA